MNELSLRRLAERAAFLHERQPLQERLNDEARARAEARLRVWRKDALLDGTVFAERLRTAGLSESELLSMFADNQPNRAGTREPSWLALFREVTSASGLVKPALPAGPDDETRWDDGGRGNASEFAPAESSEDGTLVRRFGRFVDPFAETGRSRLRADAVTESMRSMLGPGVETALVRDLRRALAFVATRTLVLELNVARTLGRLEGDTSEERLAHFLTAHLGDPDIWAAILDQYPVLARLMTATVERWLDATIEMLRRLVEDQSMIEHYLSKGTELGPLTAIRSASSDPHRGGRTVAILTFASGQKVVYKPKSLAVDVEFQHLIDWLNTIGLGFEHRMLKVLDRGAYGWVECAERAPCDTVEAVRSFYVRQGSMLALLHLLRATDMHFENVIAAGAYPILVDLETLFHHPRRARENASPSDRVLLAIQESVFSVGLLPVFALERGPASGVDFSALGGRRGQTFPHPMPTLEEVERDTMRFVLKSAETTGADNRPSLGDQPVDASAYADAVVEGFLITYSRLVAERSALEARLDRFADVEVRHIVRPTFHYTFLLNSSLHPDFLRDALGREQALNRLWFPVLSQPVLRDVVSFERADLLAGDVPLFTTRPGSRDLWSSGGERLANFFPQTSLDACRQRLAQMGDRDCAGQVKLLRLSLQALN
jgi:type 2 lantibiotic biosynthesis protein LanM